MFTAAFPVSALEIGGAKVFRHGRDQVAVFRTGAETFYAVDNRCPHEGYPLIQGTVTDCTLTCMWHNYKFDLRDGACLKGDEAVRSYPVQVTDGVVHLDLTPPDPTAAIPATWASLSDALTGHRVGQATRDAVRLLDAGVPAATLCAFVAAWNGERAEYGATHVLPLATDVLKWEPRYPGPRFAVPFAQVLDLAARDGVRRAVRPAPEPVDPGTDPVAAGAALRSCVEAEDAAGAEALLLGALARGWRRTEIEPWFFQLCADHFLSFGHRLIYQVKAFDLLEAAGWDHAGAILRGHLYGIVNGTREDLLPPWRGFHKRLDALDLPALYARAGTTPDWNGGDSVLEALVSGSAAEAFDAVAGALAAGAPTARVVDAISKGGAERMLRFDIAIDADPDNQDNWLSVTHTQTFAHAVRQTLTRFRSPDVLKLVLYAAHFVQHHRVLDGIVAPTPLDAPPAALRDALMDLAISDRFAVPIVSAHAMKNLIVAFEEYEVTGDDRFVAAVVRLLSSPVQQRWTQREALEAVAFVMEGKTPTVLAP